MSKRRAAPAAIHTPVVLNERPLPGRIRYFVGQLMQRAAQPGPDGEVDLELGGLAIALDAVADAAERELASLAAQLKFALSVPWDDERVVAAARKHHDRAVAAEAALGRVRIALDELEMCRDEDCVGRHHVQALRAALDTTTAHAPTEQS